MKRLIGNLLYGAGAVIAALFLAGSATVLAAGLGDSPAIASGFGVALAILAYGFGWSGRRLLSGRG